MEIPREVYRSPNAPANPELAELPEIIDAKTNGLRLQGTLAKALPGIAEAGSMTNVRRMEAEQYAAEIGAAFNISRQQQNRSKAIAKAKGRQMERYAKPRTKQAGQRGSAASRRNNRRAKGRSFNAAYQYGYDPNQSMR
jgi:hypothetical protein